MALGFDVLSQDLRSAVRSFWRTPGLTFVIVLTLGLAIGVNTAIFSLLNALALRDLPVRDPGSLVLVSTVVPVQGDSYLTFAMFRELSARQQVFSAVMGAGGTAVVTVSDGDTVAKGLLWAATSNLYEALGIGPAAGRLLVPADMTVDPPAAERVVVLGFGFWQRHYHGDASVIGRTVRIDGAPFTVVGIGPAGFTGFSLTTEPDLTIPLAATPLLSGDSASALATSPSRSIRAVGRLKPGVTMEQARAQLSTIWPAVREAALPASYTGSRRAEFLSIGLDVNPVSNGIERSLRARYVQPLVILLAIAGLVLLIACTNVASLLLSRATVRRHEMAVRLAVGGSRWRVARQLLTEGVVLSLAGGAVGIAASVWACATITGMVFEEFTVPVVFDGRPDVRVLGLTSALALAVGILCSALAAWRATRATPAEALQGNGRTFSTSGRAGRMLIGVQLALSLVLLTTAGLLVQSLSRLRTLNTGIERSENVLVAYPSPAHPGAYDGLDNDVYYPQLLQRIEALPGVERASASLLKPGAGGAFRDVVVRLGGTLEVAEVPATRSPVSPGFFAAVGAALTRGRDFDWGDNSRSPRVTILSESLARRLFGDSDPIGQRVRLGLEPSRDSVEVIGIVTDARLYDLKSPDVLAAYAPALQDQNASFKCLVVRGERISPSDLKRAVESLGREQVGGIVTLKYITDQSLLLERLSALMAGFFGSAVLLLAGVGLFGLLSYGVAQRRREIGIRMALGAGHRRVVRDVVSQGLTVTVAGLAVGGVIAMVAGRVVTPLIFGIRPEDPVTLAGAAGSLMAVAIIACSVPASRAARVDPATTLRGE